MIEMNIILTSLFPILLSLLLFEDAQATWSHSRHHERHNGLYKIQAGFEELFEIRNDPPPPPPHEKVAKMARYVVHLSDWIAISTISTRSPTVGRAFANVFSMSDGTNKNSSGVPFFYLTPMEMSVKDLQVHHEFVLEEQKVNKEYFLSVLMRLRERIRQKWPELWKNNSSVLHMVVSELKSKHAINTIDQPPYSSDLAPLEFFLLVPVLSILNP
ncbi:uncharacterized protein CREG isoform X4 [Lepeophtheirus salmonis]|uniref:uncharacterized protein CREG isoform X4 n=1 Tax=Lepeophtheirus salmonis TaxID=72036 RepID=UPI001AE56369|nr:uncharacterized protein LOC121116204 isoform X4 [Lepeophtheirus salmonis]